MIRRGRLRLVPVTELERWAREPPARRPAGRFSSLLT
jgi:hypothetical protein